MPSYKEVISVTFGQKDNDVIDKRNLLTYSLLVTAGGMELGVS
jgi:hypothetical protein